MSNIPEEAVEAAWQRLNEDSRGAPHKAVVYSALEAALPYLGNYTADLCEEIERMEARIKELEEGIRKHQSEMVSQPWGLTVNRELWDLLPSERAMATGKPTHQRADDA